MLQSKKHFAHRFKFFSFLKNTINTVMLMTVFIVSLFCMSNMSFNALADEEQAIDTTTISEPLSSEVSENQANENNDESFSWVILSAKGFPKSLADFTPPSWAQQLITFLAVVNTVVATAYASYTANSQKCTRGFLHINLLGLQNKAIKQHWWAYIFACLTVLSNVFGCIPLIILFGVLSMLFTEKLLCRAIQMSLFTDDHIVSVLLKLLPTEEAQDRQDWQQAIITGFDNAVHSNTQIRDLNKNSDIYFFQRCIYKGWENTCGNLVCTEICSRRLFDKHHARQRKYFEMVCYVHQYMISRFRNSDEDLQNYVAEVLNSIELLRCELTKKEAKCFDKASSKCTRIKTLVFDLHAYLAYLNMILFLKSSPTRISRNLLKEISKAMISPLTQNHLDLKALFEWTRVLAARYYMLDTYGDPLAHSDAANSAFFYSIGASSQVLDHLALNKPNNPADSQPIIGMEESPRYEDIFIGVETIIPWYSQCQRAVDIFNNLLLEDMADE